MVEVPDLPANVQLVIVPLHEIFISGIILVLPNERDEPAGVVKVGKPLVHGIWPGYVGYLIIALEIESVVHNMLMIIVTQIELAMHVHVWLTFHIVKSFADKC